MDTAEKAYIGLATFLAGVTLSGLLLAELGAFTAYLAGAGGLAAVGGFVYATRRTGWSIDHSLLAPAALVAGLLCYAVLVLFPPFDMILGGVDPGVYVNTAAHIRNSGAILVHDPMLLAAAKVPALRTVFFPYPDQYLPGFYLLNDVILPGFFHAYPALMAFVGSFVSFKNAMYLMPFLAVMNGMGLFLIVRRWWNQALAAALSVALLASNVSFVWFASYADSEMLALQFFLSGLLALHFAEITSDTKSAQGWGFLAAAFWGASLLTRMTMVLLLFPGVVAWLLYIWRGKIRLAITWASTLAIFVLWTCIHVYLFSFPYFRDVFYIHAAAPILRRHPLLCWSAIIGSPTLALAFTWALWPSSRGRATLLRWVAKGLQLLFPISLLLLLGLSGCYYFLHWQVLTWLGWYCGVPALALSFVGFILFSREAGKGSVIPVSLAIFIVAGLTSVVALGPNPLINVRHFWASRRLLVFVFPLVALLAARALSDAMRKMGKLAGISFLLVALMPGIYNTGPLIQFRMYEHAPQDIARLASRIPHDAIVLCGPTGEEKIATPLRFIYGLHTFAFSQRLLPPTALEALKKTFPGQNIFLVMIEPIYPRTKSPYRLNGDPILRIPMNWPEFDEPEDRLPRTYHVLEGNIELWQIVKGKHEEAYQSTAAALEDSGVEVQGLYSTEPGQTYRWTNGRAVLLIPGKLVKGYRMLYVDMDDNRPEPADTTIFLNSQNVGTLRVERGQVTTFSYRLPNNWPGDLAQVKLEIDSPVWVPADVYQSLDDRKLGVKLLGIDFEK